MSSIGELTFFLGLQVKQQQDGIFISQDKYVAEILRKFSLTDGKSASTSIDTEKHLLKDPDVKRIFRYLKGKPHLGLWYPKDSPFNLVAYSDSDYARASLDRKSTTGPAEVEEVIEVITSAKLMTEVVTTATTTIIAAPVPKASALRRRRGVIIQDPKEAATASLSVQSEVKSKDKGMTYTEIRPIFKKHFNSIWAFLEKGEKEIEEEESKRKSENLEQKAAKKQKINEEKEELKTHLQIVPNDEDDVYTKATPLALKVPVVDYQIHYEHNKPFYKITRADGTHQLFLSFITLLRSFDREDLEMMWKLVQERFQSSEPKNFLDDFLLNTFKIMFEKPNVEASI
nr:hypothetical protein [Tanacetum cinerariifolium]